MTTTTPHATLEIIVDIQYLSVKREKYKEKKSLEIILQDVAFNQKVGDCLRTCDRNVPFQLETL
jgi:hypothetical protein